MTKRIRWLTYFIALLLTCLLSITTVGVFASDNTSVTVLFYEDEAKTELITQQTVDVGGYVTVPNTPSKTDHVFVRWNLAGSSDKFAFNLPVSDDSAEIILVAEWKQVVFDVTFMIESQVVSIQKVEQNNSAIAPTFFNEYLSQGKVFSRWDKDFSCVTENLTVNAILDYEQYSIPVIGFDGNVIKTISHSYGDVVSIADIVTDLNIPEHYSCVSFEWITDVISQPLSNLEITQNGTIRLIFTPNDYTATFKVDGEKYFTETVKAYSSVSYPTTPIKQDYIFIGWYDAQTNDLFEFKTPITQDVVLEAKFIPIEKTKYNVTFYDGYGNQYGGVQRVEEGSSAIEPGSPYMEGYNFVGWDKDFSCVTADISVYPIYSVKSYIVTFVGDGGEVLSTVNVRYGENVSDNLVPTPRDIEGKQFVCWDNSYKNIRQDTVITATYKAKTYSVMFYDDDMNKIGVTQNVKHGESAIIPTMSKQGYIFKGWKGGDPTCITDISVFFAEYQVIQLNVTFVFNDELTDNAVDLVDYGKTVNIKQPSSRGENFTFKGWFIDNETFNNAFDFNTVVKNDIVLYACWEEKAPTVTFKIDGAIYLEQSVEVGSLANEPIVPARYGYVFDCWLIEENGVLTDSIFDFSNPISEEIVLVAKFEKITYTVTFYFGDNISKQVLVKHGEFVLEQDIPTNTEKLGYTFANWNIDILNREITGDVSVTANYIINVYNIEYIVDDLTVNTLQVPYNGYVQMISAPSKLGYTFLYWIAQDENEAYDFINNRVSKDLSLVAVYKINTYNVYYYLNGELVNEVQQEHGSMIDFTPPTFDEQTQRFLGWECSVLVVNGSDVVVRGELYKLKEFYITYLVNGVEYHSWTILEGTEIDINQLIEIPTEEFFETYINTDLCVYSFNGWNTSDGLDELPTIMPQKNLIINANLSARYYYTLSYYVNGNLINELKVLEGDNIQSLDYTQISVEDNIVLKGWKNEPSVMPAKNYRVDADFDLLEYYNIYYYVNGNIFDTVSVMETKQIPQAKNPNASDLAENETFVKWGIPDGFNEMPDLMPNKDLVIHAVLEYKQYYVLSYYINGSLYTSKTFMEGTVVAPLGEPIIDDERIVFNGWKNEPDVMPSEDTVVNADIRIREYYTIKYIINGELFITVKLLEDSVIPNAPEVSQDILPENVLFNYWETVDYVYMPSYDIEINANVTVIQYYKITYMVGDIVYNEITYLEGKDINPLGAPVNLPKDVVFNGWIGEPIVMPNKDVIVYADITENAFNIIRVTSVNNDDGSLSIKLEVVGEVNFAGLNGCLSFNTSCSEIDFATADYSGYAYMPNGSNTLNFVWSKGENVTEETILIEITINSINSSESVHLQGFNVYNVYAFTELGDIVQVDFEQNIK